MRGKLSLALFIFLFLFSCTGERILVKNRSEFPNGDYTDYYKNFEVYVQDNSGTYRIYVPISTADTLTGVAGKASDSLSTISALKKRAGHSDTLRILFVKTKKPLSEMKVMTDSTGFKDGDVVMVRNASQTVEEINIIRHEMSFQEGARKVFTVIGLIIVLSLFLWLDLWGKKQ